MPDMPVISVVDDDESSRTGIARLIRSMGFAVHDFASAPLFLTSPVLGQTACLLSDIWMPGMSGIQLHRALRAQGRNIPTILITGFPDERVRAQAMAVGVICYLSKPFEEQELEHCIDLALKKSLSH